MSYSISRLRPESKRHFTAALFLYAILALALAACGNKDKETPALDHAADTLPFPRPALEPQAVLSGTPPLPDSTQRTLDLRRAFFAGDFARLDAALSEGHEQYLDGRIATAGTRAVVNSIGDTQLAGVDACTDWLKAMPASYAAHWLCGAVWQSGAMAIRTDKFASEVSEAQFVLMRERLRRSNDLLQKAITLTPKPLEALTMLGSNHYLAGNKEQAEAFLQRAEAIMPAHRAAHAVRLVYVQPEWGGSREQVLAAMEHARASHVTAAELLDMEDEFVARPWRMSTPGAARAYWEDAIRKQPTRQRLTDLIKHFIWVQNWQDALPVATRLIENYPDQAEGYYQRARINEGLGRIPEARDDYRMAAAMGHDLALQTLIMTHIRGGLGLPGKALREVDELCRYGATLGSSVGANCMGSIFFEGDSVGAPFHRDIKQSLAWHLMAARAGHYNSQYDLGWLLYSGRAPGAGVDLAKNNGMFWMRRAAEQNHHFAKRKLEENHISPSEELPSNFWENLHIHSVLALLYSIIQILF